MKLFNRISLLLISSLVFAACERDYDAPPLNEPKYDGPAANTTIEELRAMGATVGEDAPYTIGEEKVMKAVITANDESGNIFKKIYLQDETGAIEMEVDQNSLCNSAVLFSRGFNFVSNDSMKFPSLKVKNLFTPISIPTAVSISGIEISGFSSNSH